MSEGRGRIQRGLTVGLLLVGFVGLVSLGLRELRERSARQSAFPQDVGSVAVPELGDRVTIHRDGRGVPHIVAGSERDAFAGLGFVHAQDRLGQMLWLRLRAAGRAAEFAGPEALEADRMARTLGLRRHADAQLAALGASTRELLEAYASGVNARIARIAGREVAAPLVVSEFGLPLDPWTPGDTLAVFQLYAWSLDTAIEASLVLSDLIQQLGAAHAEAYFPGRGLRATPVGKESTARASSAPVPKGVGALTASLGLDGFGIGSSAFVVGGAHTESGDPIVAVDHHLPPTAPALFHLDHLRAEGLDVAGATLPGVPVFWSGHNPRVAWGAVAAGAVVTDLYVETLSPSGEPRYHDGRRWRDLDVREETIAVRGGAPETISVRETARGPLLPTTPGREPLAVAWPGRDRETPSGLEALLALPRSGDARALVAALEAHREPVLAFAYADTDGAAGLQVAGWVPRRSLSPQLLPLPGRARWYHWTERVPADALPEARLLDGQGWLVAADASLAERAREPIDWLWRNGTRARRIEAALQQAVRTATLDLRTVTRVQNDVKVERSRDLSRALVGLVERTGTRLGPQAREIADLLSEWDGRAGAGSAGAAAYHVLLHPLAEALFEEAMGPDLGRRYLALPQTELEPLVARWVAEAAAGPADGERALQLAGWVRDGLRGAWLELSYRLGANKVRWNWGRLHRLRFEPFGGLGAALGPWLPYGGANATVAAAAYDPLDPFEVEVASTVRFAFDTGSLDQSLALLAPGQSEHPGHPHADDQVADWLEGRSALLATGSLLIEETRVARLVLEPVR